MVQRYCCDASCSAHRPITQELQTQRKISDKRYVYYTRFFAITSQMATHACCSEDNRARGARAGRFELKVLVAPKGRILQLHQIA